MGKDHLPLVSIAVITYNSSKTVIETLDSIYNQSYPNIELIISDDCSTDTTVNVCRTWILQNADRFARTEMLVVDKNSGVSANVNRAENACRGEWVKIIAGDDVLFSDGIQTYIDYISDHPDAVYVFARCMAFGGEKKFRERAEAQFRYDFFTLSKEEQYERLTLIGNCIPAATAFYHLPQMRAKGLKYDERIPLLDDWPRWINLINAGVHFEFIDKVTVKYRVSSTALSTNFENFSEAYKKSLALMYIYYLFPVEYKKSCNKRGTIQKYIRARKYLSGNSILWVIISKFYNHFFLC